MLLEIKDMIKSFSLVIIMNYKYNANINDRSSSAEQEKYISHIIAATGRAASCPFHPTVISHNYTPP